MKQIKIAAAGANLTAAMNQNIADSLNELFGLSENTASVRTAAINLSDSVIDQVKGKQVVLTGAPPRAMGTKANVADVLTKAGAKVSPIFTTKTQVVIFDNNRPSETTKLKKALAAGLTTIAYSALDTEGRAVFEKYAAEVVKILTNKTFGAANIEIHKVGGYIMEDHLYLDIEVASPDFQAQAEAQYAENDDEDSDEGEIEMIREGLEDDFSMKITDTWDDILNMIKRINVGGITPISYDFDHTSPAGAVFTSSVDIVLNKDSEVESEIWLN